MILQIGRTYKFLVHVDKAIIVVDQGGATLSGPTSRAPMILTVGDDLTVPHAIVEVATGKVVSYIFTDAPTPTPTLIPPTVAPVIPPTAAPVGDGGSGSGSGSGVGSVSVDSSLRLLGMTASQFNTPDNKVSSLPLRPH